MQRKRHISAVFLVLTAIPLAFIACAEISKWQIKEKMRRLLDSDHQTITLQLRAEEIIWMDKNEILVDGCMFDIGTRELKNGWYTFTGHFDKEETALVRKQQNTKTTDPLTRHKLTVLFKTLQQQFYSESDTGDVPFSTATLYAPYTPGAALVVCRSIPLPPPWSC
ncbi:MAG: hypothetical protein J0M10_08635 [Chitinophagales bacterium]|nr:hypothetical protein [Chitinophagales bacterium]